jgi:CPA1 family monovalent cation:H+ antiporter
MTVAEIVLGLVVLATVVAALATRLAVPAPSLLVLAGVIVGLLPIPDVHISPDVISFVVLPPLLFAAAGEIPLRELRAMAGGVLRLAVGLVAVTAAEVALVATAIVPQMTLSVGFVLGAILASTDPVAVSALARRLHLPRRLNTLVQAESLLNDATSLVLFTVAVHVVVTGGGVSWPDAVGRFFALAGGGLLVGLVLAWLNSLVRARTEDALIETVIALLTPYAAFVIAEQLDVSGVTAVVVAGLAVGARSPVLAAGRIRLQIAAVYGVLVFLLESVVFALIGLELPQAIRALPSWEASFTWLILAVFAVVLVTRIGWLAASLTIPPARRRAEHTGWRVAAVLSWAGTRGVVPLAAALSIPLTVHGGAPFPHRDLLLVVATFTIVATLVVQGFSLEPLVRRLGVVEDPARERDEEAQARVELAEAGMQRLQELTECAAVDEDVSARLGRELQRGLDRGRQLLEQGEEPPAAADGQLDARRASRQILDVQQAELRRLADSGAIGAAVRERLQHEIDQDEARLR